LKKWANKLNRGFSKEEVQMAKEHIKKCLTSLAIKETKIKIMLRFHLTPVVVTIVKNTKEQQMLARIWGKRNLCTLLVGF
jgi:hypothetical protein